MRRVYRGRLGQLKARVLAELARHGNVMEACRATGAVRSQVYLWRTQDPGFAAAWQEAAAEATDHLEAEARRRAADGVLRKKFRGDGAPVLDPETGQQYVEREYSDTLLMFLLKACAPERFRETTRHEVSGPGGAAIQFVPIVPPAAADGEEAS